MVRINYKKGKTIILGVIKRGKMTIYNKSPNLKSFSFFLALLVICIFSVNFLSAATTANLVNVSREDASNCINQSTLLMNEMFLEGFKIIRVNDSLKQAQSFYDSQVVLLEKKRKYDFSLVIPYCNDISKIREDSITAQDDLSALLKFYNDSLTSDMNTQSVDLLIQQVKDEIINERYENVKDLVDKTYAEIINVQSSSTTLNVFINSTSTGLKKFFLNNWRWITFIVVFAIILFAIYRIKILAWLTQRKIDNLNLRKKTLKELIMALQKDYFQFGKIPESEFNIKTKKFSELIRDIDRQLPLLQEEMIKFERKIQTKTSSSSFNRSERSENVRVVKKEKRVKARKHKR